MFLTHYYKNGRAAFPVRAAFVLLLALVLSSCGETAREGRAAEDTAPLTDTQFSETESEAAPAEDKAPAKPAVTAIAGSGRVTLTWEPVENATGYRVYMYDPDSGRYTALANLTGDDTEYTQKGLMNGMEYHFLVLTACGTVWSEFTESDILTVTPVSDLRVPAVTAEAGHGRVTLRWEEITGAAYRVFPMTPAAGSIHLLTTRRIRNIR